MRGVNKVILLGRLGQDPEVRYTGSGDAVASFSLATTESWKNGQGVKQEKTEWHRCAAFKRLAEIVGEYSQKGTLVYCEGKLQTRKWKDNTGTDRYSTEIVIDTYQILDNGRESNSPREGAPPRQAPPPDSRRNPNGTERSYSAPPPPPDTFDDDIPF